MEKQKIKTGINSVGVRGAQPPKSFGLWTVIKGRKLYVLHKTSVEFD